jgi:predicted nucleic acid-binding protein
VDDVGGQVPTPLILDSSVLRELARGDIETIGLVLRYDASGQPLVVPALAITQAILDTKAVDAQHAVHGLAEMDHVTVAPLRDAEQATALATVMSLTGLDVWDAHVAAVADAAVCPILTYDPAKWESPSRALEHRLHVWEIADPDQRDRPGT